MGVKWLKAEGVFIGDKKSIPPVLGAYVCILFTNGPKAALYVLVLSKGYSKSSIRSRTIHRVWCTIVSVCVTPRELINWQLIP
jgi:hypothetical protein